MSFYIYLVIGFLSGMLGGMGMGGGTLLIPALTVFAGVGQHVAQATNIIAFLPTAALSLKVHKGKGLIEREGVLSLTVPAVLTSIAGGLAAALLPGAVLKKLFGIFLLISAISGAATMVVSRGK